MRLWLAGFTLGALSSAGAVAAQPMEIVSRAHPDLVSDSAGRGSLSRIDTRHQALSADGRYAVFTSTAWNLVAGFVGTNPNAYPHVENVYLRDRLTGLTTLVSHALGQPNVSGNWASDRAVISADGGTVAFFSQATNLVALAPEAEPGWGLYVFERATGAVRLVSHVADEPLVRGAALATEQIGLSSDGRFLAFVGLSTPWVTGQVCPNGQSLIVLWDRATDTHALVSHVAGNPNACALGRSGEPSLSADGRYVAYDSTAQDVVAGQIDGALNADVFVYDRVTGLNRLVSRSVVGSLTAGNGSSSNARLSADGGWISFFSAATDLVVRQVTPLPVRGHVFLAERASGVVRLVSHATSAPHHAANHGSTGATLSDDGRFVAFDSLASDLVPGLTKTHGLFDVYLYDRLDASLTLVSEAAGQPHVTGSASSYAALVSRDGCCVAFRSAAADLVIGQGGPRDNVFLWERLGPRLRLVSHAAGKPAQAANGMSGFSFNVPGALQGTSFDLDATGDTVYFPSSGPDLLDDAADWNDGFDVFVWRRADEGLQLLSRRPAALASVSANRFSTAASLSFDGRRVAFLSSAKNLTWAFEDAHNGNHEQVFWRDRLTGTTRLVSGAHGSSTRASEGSHEPPLLSADGSVVLMLSSAQDLVPGWVDPHGYRQLFAWDASTGLLRAISHAAGQPGVAAAGAAQAVAVSADGRFVAFVSSAANLLAGQLDPAGTRDVFLHDRATNSTLLVSRAAGSTLTAGNGHSDFPALSADGRYVAFVSSATDLIAGQTTPVGLERNVFVFDRLSGSSRLVSRAPASPLAAGGAALAKPSIDDAGTRVAFESASPSLVAGQVDAADTLDVFVWERVSGGLRLASRAASGPTVAGNGAARAPRLSGNGRFVAFDSDASDAIAGQADGNGGSDVFVHDLLTSTVRLASRSAAAPTTAASAPSSLAGLSVDGGRVLFVSAAKDVVAGQVEIGLGGPHAFVYEALSGTVLLASRSLQSASRPGDGTVSSASLSADGSTVAFDSGSTDHAVGDHNLWNDVFAFALGAPFTR